MPRKLTPEEWESKFFSQIKADSIRGCWEWTGRLTQDGYGGVVYKKVATKSHRALYRHLFGDLPDEIGVLHSCDNRKCCNPFHWFIGTQKDNIDDAVKKGRQPRAIGERNQGSILTAGDVVRMRTIRKETGRTFKEIAVEFGVSEICASQAVRGYTWPHIKDGLEKSGG